MINYTIQHYSTPHNTTPHHHTTPRNTKPHHTTPHHNIPHRSRHHTIHPTPHHSTQHTATLTHSHSTHPTTPTHPTYPTHRNTSLRARAAIRILADSPHPARLLGSAWLYPVLVAGPGSPVAGPPHTYATQFTRSSRRILCPVCFCFLCTDSPGSGATWSHLRFRTPITVRSTHRCRRSHIPLVALFHRTHGSTLPIIGWRSLV